MPLIADFPAFLHGGDYNADQWWADYPEVIAEDFKLMPQAGCNAFHWRFLAGLASNQAKAFIRLIGLTISWTAWQRPGTKYSSPPSSR